MKPLRTFLALLAAGLLAAHAQTFPTSEVEPITKNRTNSDLLNGTFNIPSGATVTVKSGATLRIANGGTIEAASGSTVTGSGFGGGGGGSGTVTTFSAGDLSPLFTTSEANPTSTPALSFSLSNAAQNYVFAGPATGGTGAPAYRLLVAADIPSLLLSKISDAGQLPTWATLTPSANGQSFIAASDYAAMRGLLGLGDAATKSTGTGSGTVAAGDDSRITGAAQASALIAVNGGGINVGGLVHWTQLMGVPDVFADGSDDGSGGGSGTVTSFSAGDLSPLFTTSEANPTSTPALSFSLSNAAQNAVFAGPATGGTGAPAYRALVAADIPSLPLSKISDAGGAAALEVGATAGTVAAGDDSRITGAVQTTRTISTTAPLSGGGDLSANRTLTIANATTSTKGAASFNSSHFSVTDGAVSLGNTTVTPGPYTNANITVGPDGRITLAENGAGGGGSGNVTQGAIFANGQLVFISNNTTGEVSGIPGATFNSSNNTISLGNLSVVSMAIGNATGQWAPANGGTGVANNHTITTTATASIGGTNTGDQNAFTTIAVAGQNNIVAGSGTANFTINATGGLSATTNNTTNTVTLSGAGITGGSVPNGMSLLMETANLGSISSDFFISGNYGTAAEVLGNYTVVVKSLGTVATPTVDVAPGAVATGTVVTFSSSTPSLTNFRSTTNGTDPTYTVGTAGGNFTVSSNGTVEVVGNKQGWVTSAVASFAYTIDPIPTVSSITINTGGTTANIVFSENVTYGAGGTAGWAPTLSGGAATWTYSAGNTTANHTFTINRTVIDTETGTLAYTQPGNGAEDSIAQDLATFSGTSITNNSTETGGGGGGGTEFVTGYTLGSARTDGGDYYTGFRATIGATSLVVSDLGRYSTTGSSGTHSVYIAAIDGTPIVTGTVNATTGSNNFVYASVTPTVLTAGQEYWFMSQEATGGDTFYSDATTITTTAAASVTNSAYVATYGAAPSNNAGAGVSYGPISFKYTTGGTASAANDDFNRGSLGANWTVEAGGATIASSIRLNFTAGSWAENLAIYSAGTTNDGAGYITFTRRDESSYPFVVFRYTDSSSPFYALEFSNSSVEWVRHSSVGGSKTTLSSAPVSGSFGNNVRIGITFLGVGDTTTIRVWELGSLATTPDSVNDWDGDTTPTASFTENPASPVNTGGLVGLGTYQATANASLIDDFFAGPL